MKEYIFKNWGIMILSLFIACACWLLVTNIDNPMISRTVRNVPVTVINQNSVMKSGVVPNVQAGDLMKVTIEGPRLEVDKVNPQDIVVYADYANVDDDGEVSIIVSVRGYKNVQAVSTKKTGAANQ